MGIQWMQESCDLRDDPVSGARIIQLTSAAAYQARPALGHHVNRTTSAVRGRSNTAANSQLSLKPSPDAAGAGRSLAGSTTGAA